MNPKFKTEDYLNLGGINTKYSPYITQVPEFLNIINFDFQTIGSLTQRWGSTQYIGQTFAGSINALYEFSQLNGNSQIIVGVTGGIWSGATQTNLTGMSFTTLGSTQTLGNLSFYVTGFLSTIGHAFQFSYPQFDIYTSSGQNLYGAQNAPVYYDPVLQQDNHLSISVLNNNAFIADGNKFLRYDGVTTYPVGLPYVANANASLSSGATFYLTNLSTGTGWPAYGFSGGAFLLYMTYVNNRGFEGPLTPMGAVLSNADGFSTVYFSSGTFISVNQYVATPPYLGISSINQYYYYVGATVLNPNGNGIFPVNITGSIFYGATVTPFNFLPIFLSNTPASGSTQTLVTTGFTIGTYTSSLGITQIISNQGVFYNNTGYFPLNATFVTGPTMPFQPNEYAEFDLTNYYPRFLETYDNRLFAAGFSSAPSTVWFSEATEPEGFSPSSNFEVRTNDADYITAMKSYLTRIFFFKKNSFHVLTGDNPLNFFLQQVSDIYGCVNNRSVVTYHESMVFLDRKGVIEYNGSNLQVLSLKVQSYFDNMNYTAALSQACMLHDKLRNQILVAIPTNGATLNNITLVYDYAVQAWTSYQGFNPTVFANMQGVNTTKYPFYGDYNGRVNQFGPSLLTDNGVGATMYFKTRYIHELGQSVQKQFRRVYINADPVYGVTSTAGVTSTYSVTFPMPMNFYQDYGPSIVLSISFALGAFQDRNDFGISAKALAFELFAMPNTSPLKIHGFTIEQRMQRNV